MDFYLTKHAMDMIHKRSILMDWVENVLSDPQWIEQDAIDAELEHRLRRIPEFGDRVLRVIVNRKKSPLRVVTAYFDRRRQQYET